MAFVTSATPDITESLPASLSQRTHAVISATRKCHFDVTVGGLGFIVAPDDSRGGSNGPYIRQSSPVRKQQSDTSKEPGEQSLDGYWIRSQSSYHRGAGIVYYEPGAEEETQYRFTESSGLDVWSAGKVTAHHKMTLAQSATGPCYVANAGYDGTTQYVAYLSDTAVLGWDGASYTLNTPAAGHNGRYYFFGYKNYYKVGWTSPASATVGIWAGDPNTVVAKNATLEPRLWYAKDRLIVAHGADLFEVPPLTTTPVDLAVTTGAIHSPQDRSTYWVDVVDGPAAIYAAHRGGIVRFALENASSGSTPKLSQAYRVLDLPAGERLKAMQGYLGRFLILSTTAGIRVAAIGSDGGVTMGQVIVSPSGDIRGMSASGDIVYLTGADIPKHGTTGTGNIAGWGTATGMLALNLGQIINGDTLQFAYATDERADVSGASSSCLVIGSTKYMAVQASGIWKTHADYVSGGYLALGRARFNTLEKKIYRSFDLLGSIGTGTLRVDVLNEAEVSYHSVTMTPATGVYESVTLPVDNSYAYVRVLGTFTWTSGSPPVLNLIQLRAMPSPRRLRQLRFPLRCWDVEMDRNGQTFGRPGMALDRVRGLEEIEEAGLPVQITDHRTGESFTAMIDEIDYQGTLAPDKAKGNFDGTIRLTVTRLS